VFLLPQKLPPCLSARGILAFAAEGIKKLSEEVLIFQFQNMHDNSTAFPKRLVKPSKIIFLPVLTCFYQYSVP
jgi:hypothetical protein